MTIAIYSQAIYIATEFFSAPNPRQRVLLSSEVIRNIGLTWVRKVLKTVSWSFDTIKYQLHHSVCPLMHSLTVLYCWA